MAKRAKAPSGCLWRGRTLWADFRVRGQRIQRSLETSDPAVAKQRVAALKERATGEIHGDAKHTLGEAIEAWGRHLARQVADKTLRPNTERRYLCSMEQLATHLEGKRLTEIDLRFVTTIVEAREKTVTNATIKRDLVALSSLMNFSIDRGWIESNPVLVKLGRIKEGKRKIALPRPADVELVAARFNPPMVGALARIAMATGARLEELVSLRRDQIDHDRKQMTVIGKGDKRRTIDLRIMGGYALVAALPAYAGSPYLFWHGRGERYNNVSSNFARDVLAAEAAAKKNDTEFQRFRFHDLRHWHAVQFLKEGWGSIYELKERLGHASLITTEHYLESGFLTADEKLRAKYGEQAAERVAL
jgi:integrase/recombinase XerD